MRKAYAFEDIIPMLSSGTKPREVGKTEIRDRGMGMNQTNDLVETLGDYIDIWKWASGSQRLFDREFVKSKNHYLRSNDIDVSSGGLIECAMLRGGQAIHHFMEECLDLGFSTVEVSTGMVSLPLKDKLSIIRLAGKMDLKPKPEVGMAYGLTLGQDVEMNTDKIIAEVDACLEAGAWKVMIEEEGIFENVNPWRTDIIYGLVSKFDLKDLFFEASDVQVFNWFIERIGPDTNLFVDQSQLTLLSAARYGVWGKDNVWGRVAGLGEDFLEDPR